MKNCINFLDIKNKMEKKYKNYFIIADVHLNKNNEIITKNFESLLEKLANYENSCLIIAGDFVDFWFENKKYDLAAEYPMLENLKKYTERIDIYLIKGNRDFLADKRFEKNSGIKILGDEIILEIANKKYFITHGDIFCVKDISYKIWRLFSRGILVKVLSNIIPQKIVLWLILKLRELSTLKNMRKNILNMSIVLSEIKRRCEQLKCDIVICGHNHNLREVFLDKKLKVIVLHRMRDWGTYYIHLDESCGNKYITTFFAN